MNRNLWTSSEIIGIVISCALFGVASGFLLFFIDHPQHGLFAWISYGALILSLVPIYIIYIESTENLKWDYRWLMTPVFCVLVAGFAICYLVIRDSNTHHFVKRYIFFTTVFLSPFVKMTLALDGQRRLQPVKIHR